MGKPERVNLIEFGPGRATLQQVPRDMPLICIGQEFLDAFPVHKFVYTGGVSIVFRYFVF
jgi:SAM-dependent MidA family methyltransferase